MSFFSVVFLALLFVGTLMLGVLGVVRLLREESRPAWGPAGWFVAIGLLALALRFGVEPHRHIIYYDEFGYADGAWHVLLRGQVAITLKGDLLDVEAVTGPIRPVGFPFLLAGLYALGADPRQAGFWLNAVLGSLSIFVVARIAWLFFRDRLAALWAAFFLAVLPIHVRYSTCANPDVTAFFFMLWAVMFLAEYHRRQHKVWLWAGILAGCYAPYIKPEYALFLFAGLGVWLGPLSGPGEGLRKERANIIYAVVCLLGPLLVALPQMMSLEGQSAKGAFISWGYLAKHFSANLRFVLSPHRMGLFAVLSFLVGSVVLLRGKEPGVKWIVLWMWAVFLAASSHFAGPLPGRMERHAMVFFLPYLLIAGAGMKAILDSRWFRGRRVGLWLMALLAVHSLWLEASSVRAAGSESPREIQLQDDLALLEKASPLLPPDAYVVHECPSFVVATSPRKALAESRFLGGDMPLRVVLFRGYRWHKYPAAAREMGDRVALYYSCRPLVAVPASDPAVVFSADLCERK